VVSSQIISLYNNAISGLAIYVIHDSLYELDPIYADIIIPHFDRAMARLI
jgi:hypothetical protein